MDITPAQLLSEIEEFLKATGMAPTRFGIEAVNDGKLVSRLRSGSNMTLATMKRSWKFLQTQQTKAV